MAPKFKTQWRQEDFIYDLKWNRQTENTFIDYLSLEARIGKFIWPSKINISLLHAIDATNMQHNTDFSYCYGLTKLDLLEKRYKTFKWMLSLPGVVYDPVENLVSAPDVKWKFMLKVRFVCTFRYLCHNGSSLLTCTYFLAFLCRKSRLPTHTF